MNLDDIQTKSGINLPFESNNAAQIITDALPYIFGVAGIILLLNIISSGLKMMTSVGDPKVMQAAQAKLTTSVIGILILFTSFWIVKLIMQFLGIRITFFN